MLFKDLLDEKYKLLSPFFDELFETAIKNQTHRGDLLLVNENASLSVRKSNDISPRIEYFYDLGLNYEGHSEDTNYRFIAEYVNGANHNFKEYTKFYEEISLDEEKDKIDHEVAFTMQFEMLIYLKVWEGETFIKKWFQLAKLIKGENYDWSFRIKSHDPEKQIGSRYTRDKALKFIKPTLNELIPGLGDSFSKCHKSQIRNAIAHSQYYFWGRDVSFSNYIEDNPEHLTHLTFNDWTDIFHETLAIFGLYREFCNKVNNYYYKQAIHFRNKTEIRVNWLLHPNPYISYAVLYTRSFYKDWSPYPNY